MHGMYSALMEALLKNLFQGDLDNFNGTKMYSILVVLIFEEKRSVKEPS